MMPISRSIGLAVVTAGVPIVVALASGPAHAQAPSPGEACSEYHATTQDDTGRTMWCNPTMTGDHSLVWQYGGPA